MITKDKIEKQMRVFLKGLDAKVTRALNAAMAVKAYTERMAEYTERMEAAGVEDLPDRPNDEAVAEEMHAEIERIEKCARQAVELLQGACG